MKTFEIFIRKLLLNLLLFISKKPERTELPKFSRESKILFIRLNRIGDALISTPLLKTVKESTGCKIYVLAAKSNYFIFENQKIADEVIVFDKKKNNLFSLIKLLNSRHFDAVVDLHDDVSSTVSYIVAFLKCKYKFGLQKGTENLYSHVIAKLDSKKIHVVDRLMEFSKFFQIGRIHSDINIVFDPKKDSFMKSEEFLKLKFSSKKFLIGINISAGSEARFWGAQNYKTLIDSLRIYDVNILLMCVERDINFATEISGGLIPVYYNSDFEQFSTMISLLDLFFTPDTSVVHIASAFRKPVFGIYVQYNTNDMIWAPYKSPFECIITKEPTLKNITFESVNEKLLPFFEKYYYEYSTKPD